MSNHPHRRRGGHLPDESAAPNRRRGFLGWLFGSGVADPDSPVTIADVSSRAEAELMAGFLRDKGIHAVVAADDEGGLSPNLAAMRRVRVLVHRRDEARATELLGDANGD
jgi:hypothetical protein